MGQWDKCMGQWKFLEVESRYVNWHGIEIFDFSAVIHFLIKNSKIMTTGCHNIGLRFIHIQF